MIGENLTMFAVYAYKANPDDPLAALAIVNGCGRQPCGNLKTLLVRSL
jgi:hypothetical protein